MNFHAGRMGQGAKKQEAAGWKACDSRKKIKQMRKMR